MDEATAIGRSRSTSPRPVPRATPRTRHPSQRVRVGTQSQRIESAADGDVSAKVFPVDVGQSTGPIRIDGAGEQSRSQAGDTEREPSSSGNTTIASGRGPARRGNGAHRTRRAPTRRRAVRRKHRHGHRIQMAAVTTASAWVPYGACRPRSSPLRSTSTSRPRFSACATNQLPKWCSAAEYTGREYPPRCGSRPMSSISASSPATVSTGAVPARSLIIELPCAHVRVKAGQQLSLGEPFEPEVRRRDVRSGCPVDDQIGHQIADGVGLILNPVTLNPQRRNSPSIATGAMTGFRRG